MATEHEHVEASTALDEAVRRVGDRWTLLLVEALLPGPQRFGELLAGLDGLRPTSSRAASRRSRLTASSPRRPTRGARTASPTR